MKGVLTNKEILECLNKPISKDPLFISPILDPVMQIGNTTVDLRLGQYFLLQKPSSLSALDVFDLARNPLRDSMIAEGYTTVRVPYGSSFTLHADQSIRISSFEYIGMPMDLIGEVTLRHSLASIPIMADEPTIQPGFRGVVVLSLKNHSMQPVILYPGMRIAQIRFEWLSSKVKLNKVSRYLTSTMPTPIRVHEDEEIRFLGPYADPLIIGIASKISSGRSTSISYLSKNYPFINFALGRLLKDIAREDGLTYSRSMMQEIGNKVRERDGNEYLAKELRSSRDWIENKHSLVIVDAFKHCAEVEEFRSKQNRFYLVGIDAPEAKRREWEKIRQNSGDRVDQISFDEVDLRDRGIDKDNKPYSQQVDKVMNIADEIIFNNGTKEDLFQKLDEMVIKAKKHIHII